MVLDLGVSNIPMPVFMLVHFAGLAIGATLAYKAFHGANGRHFGWAFSLFAIAEVLDLVALILAFVGASHNLLYRRAAANAARA